MAISGSAAAYWLAIIERLRWRERDTRDGRRGRAHRYGAPPTSSDERTGGDGQREPWRLQV